MRQLVILGLIPLIIFAVAFFLTAHELEIRGEIQQNNTDTNIIQNSTINKFKMKSYFENAINELDKGNMVGVHQQLKLAEMQFDTIPQNHELEPQRELSEQEDVDYENENEHEEYESGYENENEDY